MFVSKDVYYNFLAHSSAKDCRAVGHVIRVSEILVRKADPSFTANSRTDLKQLQEENNSFGL